MNITSKIVALSSAVAFALQTALALLMLRYFSPEEVGVFSVISQIGFFWTTLALAQTPLRLLANHGASVFDDARHAWTSSLQRFVWLSPVVALAVWWSGLSFVNALLWALLLSLCQLTWMLAQSMRLRMVGAWSQVGVRVLPPLIALLFAVAAVFIQWRGPALLAAALLGYAVGAAWLLPALLVFLQDKFSTKSDKATHSLAFKEPRRAANEFAPGDNRSASLRMAHTLADALLATAIVVVWQRLYSEQETGWIAAPLRVMGFVPALVHVAWAQVMLAQPQYLRTNPLWIGLCGFACVALFGVGCALSIEMGWLGERWYGVQSYLLPLVLWQGSACLSAAYSYLPFQAQCARLYSFMCIGVTIIQSVILLIPTIYANTHSAPFHLLMFGAASALLFIAQTIYINHLGSKNLKSTH